METNRKIVNIGIDSELWRIARAQAILDKKTITQWVSEAIKYKLEKNVK